MYTLTKAGETVLSLWVDVLSHYQTVLKRALRTYEKQDPKVAPRKAADAEPSPDEAGATS
jgi:hypothetical protein